MGNEYRKFPLLETERLTLRDLRTTDALDVYRIGGDDEVMCFYDMDTFLQIADAEEFIERQRLRFDLQEGIRWALTPRGGNRVVGWCGYTLGPYHRAEFGYVLARTEWNQGYMTEAAQAIVEFIFSSTEVNRLEAITHPTNESSARVLAKLGFIPEGLLRDFGYWRGGYHDMKMHALLRRDHFRRQETD